MGQCPKLTVNTSDLEIIRAHQSLMGSLDTKRPDAWAVYGYSEDVRFQRMLTPSGAAEQGMARFTACSMAAGSNCGFY